MINILPAYRDTVTEPVAVPEHKGQAVEQKPTWYQSVSNTFAEVKSVIKVRKKANHDVSLTEVDVGRAQFKLIIEQLRWAAFYNNSNVYYRSIANAQALLPELFDMQSESVQKFAQTLQALQKVQLQSAVPSMQNSVNALQAILVG